LTVISGTINVFVYLKNTAYVTLEVNYSEIKTTSTSNLLPHYLVKFEWRSTHCMLIAQLRYAVVKMDCTMDVLCCVLVVVSWF